MWRAPEGVKEAFVSQARFYCSRKLWVAKLSHGRKWGFYIKNSEPLVRQSIHSPNLLPNLRLGKLTRSTRVDLETGTWTGGSVWREPGVCEGTGRTAGGGRAGGVCSWSVWPQPSCLQNKHLSLWVGSKRILSINSEGVWTFWCSQIWPTQPESLNSLAGLYEGGSRLPTDRAVGYWRH